MPQEVAVWLCMSGRTGWEEKRMPATGSGTAGSLRSGSRRRRRRHLLPKMTKVVSRGIGYSNTDPTNFPKNFFFVFRSE